MRNKIKYYTSDKTPYDIAAYRVSKIRKFYLHLFFFALGLAIYISRTYIGAPFNFEPLRFINLTVLSIWAFIIAIKAIKLFSRELFFGKNWENKKMEEFMGQEKTTKWE